MSFHTSNQRKCNIPQSLPLRGRFTEQQLLDHIVIFVKVKEGIVIAAPSSLLKILIESPLTVGNREISFKYVASLQKVLSIHDI